MRLHNFFLSTATSLIWFIFWTMLSIFKILDLVSEKFCKNALNKWLEVWVFPYLLRTQVGSVIEPIWLFAIDFSQLNNRTSYLVWFAVKWTALANSYSNYCINYRFMEFCPYVEGCCWAKFIRRLNIEKRWAEDFWLFGGSIILYSLLNYFSFTQNYYQRDAM